MSTQVMGTVLRPGSAARPGARRVRLEHVVMAGAILSLIILVVLPLLWLFYGSLRGEQGLSLDHFSEIFRGLDRLSSWNALLNFLMTGQGGGLYLNALRNSLVLGAWTGLFSLLIGLV